MRVLVVTNMTPDAGAPARGSFIRDQVAALRDAGVQAEMLEFPVGAAAYPRAVRAIRRRLSEESFDVVHAHYGLVGWCAVLAGASPLLVTFHGTDVRHPVSGRLSRRLVSRLDVVAPVSRELLEERAGAPGLPAQPGRTAILPCGADTGRFRPIDRAEAREALDLDPRGRYLLFPASPERAMKRFDRAEQVARLAGAELLTGGDIDSERMPLWMNAAAAVLVPSDYEGFGLVAVEALACDLPVLSTPVGIAPALLDEVEGCLAAPFDAPQWAALARSHLDGEGRVGGRDSARRFSARRLADRVAAVYQELADGPGGQWPDLS